MVDRLLEYVARTDDVVGVTDDAGRVLYLNQASRKRLGLPEDATGQVTTAELFPAAAFQTYFDEIRPAILHHGVWSGMVPCYTAGGDVSQLWMTVVGEPLPGGEVAWLVTSGRDVTEWVQASERMSWQAKHDDLTGLVRRGVLEDRLGVALAQLRRSGGNIAVVFMDVESLKWINDSFGHPAGDAVLTEVARRATAAVREADTVARVGGDEFVVLLAGVADAREADQLAGRLLHAITEAPVETAGLSLSVSLTIGTAVGSGESDPDELLARADAAMLGARRHERHLGRAGEAEEGGAHVSAREVSAALTQRQIGPVYQRVVDLRRGLVVGYQAQARWGSRPAAEFIDLIEGSGMILSLDLAMLRRASADAATWWARDQRVYVHASARFLAEPRMEWYLRDIVDRAHLDPGRVWLNISEHLLARRTPAFSGAIAAVRDLGVHVVLSNAGHNCPPLAELASGTFEEFRLAPPLVAALTEKDGSAVRAVAGAIALAHGLGMTAHAVGVGHPEALSRLVDLGCDLAEGNALGPLETAIEVGGAHP